ncbi:hypothetical protein [Pseudonocardia sp. KRD291]|uniref:hypothetical protein n=1 Tax=Pseudonocardia sp. KRD291 TaxID=2792007 RepID=UPI001C4A142F|nr:hypothetical protein [Pseudonocardia sp. KRD291]MBW0103701.1 hypothetical protein [Pseudonocardia sp. KRD291]
MARHWVQETPADTRRATWSTAPVPDTADEPAADVRPIVPAARRPAPTEVQASEAASA